MDSNAEKFAARWGRVMEQTIRRDHERLHNALDFGMRQAYPKCRRGLRNRDGGRRE